MIKVVFCLFVGFDGQIVFKPKNIYRGYRGNVSLILQYSNACPFRWSQATFSCSSCPLSSPEFSDIREHAREHTEEALTFCRPSAKLKVDITDLACKICESKFDSLVEFKEHLVLEHDIKINPKFSDGVIPFMMKDESCFPCVICHEKFELFSTLNKHMNAHDPTFICSFCGKNFLNIDRLRRHLHIHENSENYKCSRCPEVFTSWQARNNHLVNSHITKKRNKCPYCQETFKEYLEKLRHMKNVHDKTVEYKCNLCGATFELCSLRTRHLANFHGIGLKKVFTCGWCSKTCVSASKLKQHSVKHSGEKNFKCGVCFKAYARKKTLKEHLKIHYNIKDHVCAYCDRAFVQKSSLNSHLKTHHPTAPDGKRLSSRKETE